MSSKPKILAKPKHIKALELRKKPKTDAELAEMANWYEKRAASDELRRLWDVEKKRALEAKRTEKREKREQKAAALKAYQKSQLELKIAKKEAKLKWVHRFLGTVVKEDISHLPDFEISILSRLIGTAARETRPTKFVGWESANYLISVAFAEADGTKKPKATEEHFYPQQFFGLFLLTHIRVCQYISRAQFDRYMEVFNQVAHVTKKENEALGCGDDAPQNPSKFTSPERAYREAGVDVNFTPIKRLEDVAPREVLEAFFGDRLEEVYKYKC